jgi:hypothetical protein
MKGIKRISVPTLPDKITCALNLFTQISCSKTIKFYPLYIFETPSELHI